MTIQHSGIAADHQNSDYSKPAANSRFKSLELSRRPIVLLDRRTLNRDCLTKALVSGYGLDVIPVAEIQDWIRTGQTEPPAIVLLFVSGWLVEAEINNLLSVWPKSLDIPPIIVFSDDENIKHIVSALEKGARGYIAPSTPLDVVVEALNLVIAGGTFIPASSIIAAQRNSDETRSSPAAPVNGFTARQTAIIEKLRIGKSNKLIAYELSMCESTVKVHVRNIMKKLNAKNRTEVAFLASRLAR
ncbi:LuxR family two component transcriptional regulator [Hyphomicrobium denitrificans 1NES1]|uniref:LuxR family two component transcriptional regulator n=1 Tax=Hyphomicrobium denitrificans 1NES1 TaxID=670307 RepID=N0BBU8_9HYPH|nr:response regulator transcription factor [Hyphomicrobium denitrificans]AGK57600.1 LuxR family two component transcriptional regulator [Hyphomicrobium denitrificans 1NES1]